MRHGPRFPGLALAAALAAAVVAPAAASEIRWRYTSEGLELEIRHPDGLIGHVVRHTEATGRVEASAVLSGCPTVATLAFPLSHPVHPHWVFWTPCGNAPAQAALQGNLTNMSWESAAGTDFASPIPEQALIQRQAEARFAAARQADTSAGARLGLALFLGLAACGLAGFAVWRGTLAEGRPLLPPRGDG